MPGVYGLDGSLGGEGCRCLHARVRPQPDATCGMGMPTACSRVPGVLRLGTESKNVTVGVLDLHLIGPRPLDRCLKELDTLALIFDKQGVDILDPDPDPCP
jgi:hypothetical protein